MKYLRKENTAVAWSTATPYIWETVSEIFEWDFYPEIKIHPSPSPSRSRQSNSSGDICYRYRSLSAFSAGPSDQSSSTNGDALLGLHVSLFLTTNHFTLLFLHSFNYHKQNRPPTLPPSSLASHHYHRRRRNGGELRSASSLAGSSRRRPGPLPPGHQQLGPPL